jgi:predicted nucleic acid-binding protein
MIVVADASPLIALTMIVQTYILNAVFDEIKIPKAVFKENNIKSYDCKIN